MPPATTLIPLARNLWDEIVFRVTGNGFLHHMVRIMTGTLADVAFGALSPEKIPAIIAAGRRVAAGENAPPDGLYLTRVFYDEKDFSKTE